QAPAEAWALPDDAHCGGRRRERVVTGPRPLRAAPEAALDLRDRLVRQRARIGAGRGARTRTRGGCLRLGRSGRLGLRLDRLIGGLGTLRVRLRGWRGRWLRLLWRARGGHFGGRERHFRLLVPWVRDSTYP